MSVPGKTGGRTASRVLSVLLSAVLVVTAVPPVFGTEATGAAEGTKEAEYTGAPYFDFEASEYEASEGDGQLLIKVVRHGSSDEAVDVSFKAADYLSEYGADYVILGEDGNPLAKAEGIKPDASGLEYENTGSPGANVSDSTADTADTADAASQDADTQRTVDTVSQADLSSAPAAAEAVSTKKSSSLTDAALFYINAMSASEETAAGAEKPEKNGDSAALAQNGHTA